MLFAAPATVDTIEGWSKAESQILLRSLFEKFNWPEVTVLHSWKEGDLLVWPNRRYPHRTLPLETGSPRRLMRLVGHWDRP